MQPHVPLRAADVFRYELQVAKRLPMRGVEGANTRSGWIVALHATDDANSAGELVGYGEVAPLESGPDENARIEEELLQCVEQLRSTQGARTVPANATACVRHGITSALDDLTAKLNGTPLHRWYADEAKGSVPVNALCRSDTTDYKIADILSDGYRSIKVKVGRGAVDEEARGVRRISALVGGAPLRLDANRAWSLAEAVEFADRLRGIPLDYVEEPLREPDGLGALHEETGWALALDESLHNRMPEVALLLESRPTHYGISAVVLKPSMLGPPREVFELARMAREVGIRPVISSSMESGIGLRVLAAMAAHPLFAGAAAGLSTHDLYEADTCVPKVRFGAVIDVDDLMTRTFDVAEGLKLVRSFS